MKFNCETVWYGRDELKNFQGAYYVMIDIRHTPFDTAGDQAIYHPICLPSRIEKSLFCYDATQSSLPIIFLIILLSHSSFYEKRL